MTDVPPKATKSPRKSGSLFVIVLRCLLLAIIMLAVFQRSLIYHPHKVDRLSAADSGMPHNVVDVAVTTSDKQQLNGWLVLKDSATAHPRQTLAESLQIERPLVIVFPGNAGDRGNRTHLLQLFLQLDADSMIFDYRGYGDNSGTPSEAKFATDARAIWKYVTEELNVPANRVVLYGESLGGGVATRLAGDLGKDGVEPGGLILQSTFNSLVDTGGFHFPFLPVSLLLIDRFESQKHITSVKCPILQIHGTKDDIVPLSLGQKLYDAAPDKSAGGIPKQQLLLAGINHNDVYYMAAKLVSEALGNFLEGVRFRERPLKK